MPNSRHTQALFLCVAICASAGWSCRGEQSSSTPPCATCLAGVSGPLAADGRVDVTTVDDQPTRAVVAWGQGWALLRADGAVGVWSDGGTTRALDGVTIEGAPRAAVALDAARLLVSTDAGLFAISAAEGARDSDLSDLFGEVWPDAMHVTSDAEGVAHVWLSSALGVYHWSDGVLERVAAQGDGPPLARARLALAPGAPAEPVIWAAAGTTTYMLRREDAAEAPFSWQIATTTRGADAMATSRDALWTVYGGEVWRRDAEGAWSRLSVVDAAGAGAAIDGLAANPQADALWLHDTDGGVWHLLDRTLTRTPDVLWGDARAVDAEGRLLVADARGVHRVERRLHVSLPELRDGDVLDGARTVRVHASFKAQLESLDARAGDLSLPVDLSAGTLELDPATLGLGAHRVVVTARYAGGYTTSVTRTVRVEDVLVTWRDTIQPIYARSCETCHGVQTSRPLHDPQQWRDDFDNILSQVEQQTMPLPPLAPLNAAQLGLLRAWRDQGFLVEPPDDSSTSE